MAKKEKKGKKGRKAKKSRARVYTAVIIVVVAVAAVVVVRYLRTGGPIEIAGNFYRGTADAEVVLEEFSDFG